MEKIQNPLHPKNTGSILSQKTFEDFNKEKPNPSDDVFQVPKPSMETPIIGLTDEAETPKVLLRKKRLRKH